MDWNSFIPGTVVGAISITIVYLILKTFIIEGIKRKIDHYYQKKHDEFKNDIDREMELHKSNIRLYEFIYPKKLEALNFLFAFREKLILKQPFPDMDYNSYLEFVTKSFDIYEKELKNILIKFGGILNDDIVKYLNSAVNSCAEGKFEYHPTDEPTKYQIEMAEQFVKNLDKVISNIRNEMEIQLK